MVDCGTTQKRGKKHEYNAHMEDGYIYVCVNGL